MEKDDHLFVEDIDSPDVLLDKMDGICANFHGAYTGETRCAKFTQAWAGPAILTTAKPLAPCGRGAVPLEEEREGPCSLYTESCREVVQ